jgi:hypothetical protein
MTCTNELSGLKCINPKEHTGGPDRKGCVFISSASAYDRKEENEEGVTHDD